MSIEIDRIEFDNPTPPEVHKMNMSFQEYDVLPLSLKQKAAIIHFRYWLNGYQLRGKIRISPKENQISIEQIETIVKEKLKLN